MQDKCASNRHRSKDGQPSLENMLRTVSRLQVPITVFQDFQKANWIRIKRCALSFPAYGAHYLCIVQSYSVTVHPAKGLGSNEGVPPLPQCA
jgi:hypothetical protein